MRIGIVGQKWFAAEVLRRLSKSYQIVFAAAPNASDRLARAALELGLSPFHYKDAPLNEAEVPQLDLLITAHAYVKVPADVISRARFAVGYHPSLLPLYRGMGAVQKTLANGDPVAGGSVYHLTEGFDEGPIAAQDWCFVRPEDGPIELWRRELAPIGVRLLSETAIELARSGTIVGRPQDEGMTRALRETEAGLKAV